MIHTFIKNKHDFGKRPITSHLSEYTQHYPRSRKNDIHVYFYPETKSVGIYQVTEEKEYYGDNEGFQYVRGHMKNLVPGKNGDVKGFLNRMLNHELESHRDIGKKLDDIIYNLQMKYTPEVFKKVA